MELGRYLVEAHLREGRSVAELAEAHGIHRSWIYKLVARYRAEGEAGLAPRSRRPRSSPTATPTELEDEIVLLRKQLAEEGLDAGAVTIHWHLGRRHDDVPSVSSIWRVLKRRGFVVPQPKKRPRSSFIRFAAELPNETWQSDMTHWALGDGSPVEIVNFIDDHSRLCVASVALAVTKATDVAEIFIAAAQRHGTPAAVLTDNGCIYTAAHRGRQGSDGDPARDPGSHLQALEPLSPPNLRQDRALPPDRKEVPDQTSRRRRSRRVTDPARPLRRLLQPGPSRSASWHRAG